MRKMMIAMFIASIGLFTSCDKCKKADCQNGATCEKKVGDCECATFYEGDKCENEVRAAFSGTYSGTAKLGTSTLPTSIAVSNGSGVSGLTFTATITTPSGSTIYNVTGTLTDNTNFTIPAQSVPFTLSPDPRDVSAMMSGSGTLTGSSANATLNFKLNASQINLTAQFSGSK
ncbi:MAG: hypothetical protein KDC83_12670 [Flavobacteriales bacterium]|nr:hypothetical protein [Flavobacteriales bacterium]